MRSKAEIKERIRRYKEMSGSLPVVDKDDWFIENKLYSFADACMRQLHSPSSPSNCNDLYSYY